MTGAWQDFIHVAQVFGKSPGVSAFGVQTLAPNIGANTAIFGGINVLSLRCLTDREVDGLVHAREEANELQFDRGVSPAEITDLNRQSQFIEGFGVFAPLKANGTGLGALKEVAATTVRQYSLP